MSPRDINALYVGVWDPARGAYVKAYGTADVAGGRAASIDDSFRIGSTTKTFTATVILQLVDEGKLALDATLADAAPGVAAKYPTIADRTIEQLLSMTGGIPDYTEVPDGVVAGVADGSVPGLDGGRDDRVRPDAAAVAGGHGGVLQHRLPAAPGGRGGDRPARRWRSSSPMA